MDAAEYIWETGQNMMQFSRNVCGPLSVIHDLIRRNSARFLRLLTSIYVHGNAKSYGSKTITLS